MANLSSPNLSLFTILSESKRILNAHSRHFLALCVLFLLPLSFSLVVYPTLLNLITHPPPDNPKVLLRSFLDFHPLEHDQPIFSDTQFLSILYSLFVFAFSILAIGSITFSVFHGFYGRPVKLISTIKSVFLSFLPLFVTVVITRVVFSLIVVAFGGFLLLVTKNFELYSNYLVISGGVLLVLVLGYLQVNWTLACVVAVVESSWGFEPLRRSASLMRGMRKLGLSLFLFFGVFGGILVWTCGAVSELDIGDSDGWKSWGFVVQIVVTSTLLMLLLLYYAAANTVLYMYCKALHGELAVEIAEEFAREYVSLPFDDGKVPHVISVVIG
ncbi:uncharacterized protein LOC126718925 [Quercus robur]|uniref:uncharacterized protein LOC126718925 n=1 Tax=Quercus robur TaxID=38942 RepID=UPI002162F57D|nr:uncharacterized protein LOC126718925 [Quercus robur]XP_050277288.1 uncharacterized protein LOC126718925 [Quercus robur]